MILPPQPLFYSSFKSSKEPPNERSAIDLYGIITFKDPGEGDAKVVSFSGCVSHYRDLPFPIDEDPKDLLQLVKQMKTVSGHIEITNVDGSIQKKKLHMRLPDDIKKRESKIARIFEYLKIPMPPAKESNMTL